MDKEILKSALFGYSKISVCQYIATMNEEFNAKLMAEADSFREERSRLQKKIDDLEAELAALKQNACDVGTMLLEAGQYAEQLRQQAQEEAAELLQQAQEEAEQLRSQAKNETDQLLLEIKTKGQAQTQKLELYTGAIVKLREDMAILANRTDDALNTFAEQFLSLRQDFEDSEI
ncbi:MAG: DivIVA domain-containing protein [Oscillibacter sp.]|nr:DivIVA domain-containing protein [Oscillibacter sp.]